MTATLALLRAAGVLSPLDEHFARAMCRLGGDERPEVVLAAALTSRNVSDGHVCLDVSRLCESPVHDSDGNLVAENPWPPPAAWLQVLGTSPLIGNQQTAGLTPFVLDEKGRLYLRRYWQHESGLAKALLARASHVEAAPDAAWVRATLDRLFTDAGSGRPDWQRIATFLALQRRLCVISGGPGTGKTFTVVKVLALLIEAAVHAGGRAPHVTLLAPTGKAAARLSEAIRAAKASLNASTAVKDAIPENASTIHRCLSPIAGSATNFRYHADNPLVTDVVLVDEASMVDLALMSRLVAAVPAAARLILIGDQDQLASVEAGAVLGDICNAGASRRYSLALGAELERTTGDRLPPEAVAGSRTGIWDCIVQLTRSYRYREDSGIGALARAINAGDAEHTLALLESGDAAGIERFDAAADTLTPALRGSILGGFGPGLQAHDPIDRLHALQRFRVLCAHRHGPGGVETLNRQIQGVLADAGLIEVSSVAYSGRPVLVTRNDYGLDLFNGDVGVIVDDSADPSAPSGSSTGEARALGRAAVFLGQGGRLRRFSPARLPPHETVYAMSIHKSQGSEFDQVAIVLPPRPSPVLSRELLYTAVTRARQRVSIHAATEVIAQCVTRRIERASGLRDVLWG